MSLRTKLTIAFVVVALVALVPAVLVLNLGLFASARMGMGMGMGHGMGGRPEGMLTMHEYFGATWQWSLWSGLGALAVAAAAGLFTAGRITRSLTHLRTAAAGLDLRDLSRRVPVEGQDEIGDLARTFNKMADRLEAGERARRQLLADTAHELRHPLAVLKGRLDLMQEGKVELAPEELLPLQDEVIRLTRLVGDLRDLSLAEVGQLSLNLTSVRPAEVLERLRANLEPVAEAKSITLTTQALPDLPAVAADPDRLRQILLNLVANALQFTPAGGRVDVVAERRGAEVAIAIRDSGPGIAEEDLPHIFDRFYRSDKSRSRATGGTGLGLAIVRSLVELHQGRITVESTPGQGTCFTVILPAGGGSHARGPQD